MPILLKSPAKYVDECASHSRAVRFAYAKAVEGGENAKSAQLADLLVHDPKCRLHWLVEANAKLPPRHRLPLKQLIELAGPIDLTKPHMEKVRLKPVEKKDGSFRPTLKFGLRHKAEQIAFKALLAPHFKPRAWQHGQRGVQSAIKQIRQHVKAGASHHAHYDIMNFFGSFDTKALKKFAPKLLQGLWANTVGSNHLNISTSDVSPSHSGGDASLLHSLTHQARQGLPQGSIASPLIADWHLSSLALLSGVHVVNYADNFCLLASSEAELQYAITALHDAIAALPAGNFTLKKVSFGPMEDGFDFLGHSIGLDNSELAVRPTHRAVQGVHSEFTRLTGRLFDANDKAEAGHRLGRMRALLDGWRAAYSECEDVNAYTAELEIELADYAAYWNVSPAAMAKEAKHEWINLPHPSSV